MTIGPLQLVFIQLDDEQRTLPISKELKAVRMLLAASQTSKE